MELFLAENFQLLLPDYLTSTDVNRLKNSLLQFRTDAKSINYSRFYRATSVHSLYQGDRIMGIPCPQFVKDEYQIKKYADGCLLLSNTCDMSSDNKRDMPMYVCLAPVSSLEDYKIALEQSGVKPDAIPSKITALQHQHITNLFYLPGMEDTSNGFVCYLDQCFYFPLTSLQKNIQNINRIRASSLDYFGLYLLALKLSFHFCRLPLESL